jgi:hypothetical protein
MKGLILALALALGGCAVAAQTNDYFPDGTYDAFGDEWFSDVLVTLQQPSLMVIPPTGERVYRITVIPTWGEPQSVMARVAPDRTTLSGAQSDGQGGYDLGRLSFEKTVVVKNQQARDLSVDLAVLDGCAIRPESLIGMDGTTWVFEYSGPRGYCSFDVWELRDDTLRPLSDALFVQVGLITTR